MDAKASVTFQAAFRNRELKLMGGKHKLQARGAHGQKCPARWSESSEKQESGALPADEDVEVLEGRGRARGPTWLETGQGRDQRAELWTGLAFRGVCEDVTRQREGGSDCLGRHVPVSFSAHAYSRDFKILSLLRLQYQCWDSEGRKARVCSCMGGVGGGGGVSFMEEVTF